MDGKRAGKAGRWFDMLDWRSANVGRDQWGVTRSIEGYTKKLEGEVDRQHQARVWVERKEPKSAAKDSERMLTPHECASHLLQIVTGLQQDATEAAIQIGWRAADPSRYPEHVCRGLTRLLSHGEVSCDSARWLAKQIGNRLPPGWGMVCMDKGCRELEGTLAEQLRTVVNRTAPNGSGLLHSLVGCAVGP